MCVTTNFHLISNDRNCLLYSQAYLGDPVPQAHLVPEPLNLVVPSWSSSPILGSTSVLFWTMEVCHPEQQFMHSSQISKSGGDTVRNAAPTPKDPDTVIPAAPPCCHPVFPPTILLS